MPERGFEGPPFEEQGGFLDARRAQGLLFGDYAFQLNAWLAEPGRPERWPLQVGRPPLQASAFQPRELLSSGSIKGPERTDSPPGPGVVLVGDGGVGKTQLAAAVFREASDVGTDLRVWVDASSRSSVVVAYAQAAAVTDSAGTAEDVEAAAGRFLDWLAVTDRTWLVVLDDVADPVDVRGLWPIGPTGSVVATTRRRDFVPADAEHIEVGVFTPTEACSYLTDRLAGTRFHPLAPGALVQAEELAEALGRLPVALAQAAAVLFNEGITCAQYLERFNSRVASLAELFPADAAADEYQHTVAAAWSLAIDRADALPPVGLARQALRIAAAVDPNGVPEELWAARPALEFAGRELGMEKPSSSAEMRSALRNLHRLSLLTHDPAGGPLAVRTHALVQRATLEPLLPEDLHRIVRTAADAVMDLWTDSTRDSTLSKALRRTTATLVERGTECLTEPDVHEVLFRAGDSFDYAEALQGITYWTDLAAMATRVLGAEHPATLRTRRKLVRRQGGVDDPWRAATDGVNDPWHIAADMEVLVADHTRVLGHEDPGTLEARAMLAELRGEAGDHPRAITEMEDLLDDYERVLGPDDRLTLQLRRDLAVWRSRDDVKAAVTDMEQLLADQRRLLGADHPDTFDTRLGLARLQRNPARAVTELEQLLADYLRTRKPDDLEVLYLRGVLAWARSSAGDASRAAIEAESVLAGYERIAGAGALGTLYVRFVLASLRGRAGDPSRAVADMQDLLADQVRILGPDHHYTLPLRRHLAHWQGHDGDPAAAVNTLTDLVADYLRLFGQRGSLSSLRARFELAYWRGRAGDPNRAIAELAALLSDHQHEPLFTSFMTLRVCGELAHLRATVGGDPSTAVVELTQLLDDYQRRPARDPRLPLRIRRYVATWRGRAGDPAGAVTELEALLIDHQRLLGPDDSMTLEVRDELAHWLRVTADAPTNSD